jgi:polyphosphate kinase
MQPVRLELNPNFPNELLDFILEYLGLSEEDVYVYSRPLNLPDFMVLLRLDLPALKDQPFTTRIIKEFQGDNVHF